MFARRRGGGGEVGMMRLLDLHAVSCAGDTLVTMGLAGTAFFRAQDPGAARGQVGLYLLLTMAPFALIAPVVGPVLDRFRHGRRVALAVTMFGRAFLAWVISDYIHGFGLYPPAPVPAVFKRNGKALYGRLVFATLTNSAILRALYGFLALFLLFAVRARHLSTQAFGFDLGQGGALALIIGALGVGSFLATAV